MTETVAETVATATPDEGAPRARENDGALGSRPTNAAEGLSVLVRRQMEAASDAFGAAARGSAAMTTAWVACSTNCLRQTADATPAVLTAREVGDMVQRQTAYSRAMLDLWLDSVRQLGDTAIETATRCLNPPADRTGPGSRPEAPRG